MGLSYQEIVKSIENNLEINNVPEEELHAWQRTLEETIKNTTDQEDLAVKNVYLLLFLLKTKRSSLKVIKEHYKKIKLYFEGEEKLYQQKLKVSVSKTERKLLFNQLISFYKLAEFYLSYIEESFYLLSLKELKNEAYLDKLRFLQRHQLLEKKYFKFFSYSRMYISHQIKKHTFLYAFLGVLGVSMMWQGLWGTFDWIIAWFGWDTFILPYIFNATLGAFILYNIGLFFSETVGLEEEMTHPRELRHLEEMAQKKNQK